MGFLCRSLVKTAVLLSTLVLSHTSFAHHEIGNEKSYTLGVVPQFEQRKLFQIWQPIVDELEKRTGFNIHLQGSPRIPEFEKSFIAGEYDFVYMNPFHSLRASASQGYIPLIRDGGRELYGVLVVRSDSDIQSIDDLDGKRIAFPAPNAFGASLMIRADLDRKHSINFVPSYVQTHSSVYLNVALRQVQAGGGVMSTLRAQKPELSDKLRVLYETQRVAPHPISAHPRVPETDRQLLQQALLSLSKEATGKKLLSAIPIREAVKASSSDYEKMLDWGLDHYWVSH
ncbi:phosphate/phosphite/phosphonate ABC transporter substrate-binding protein [Motiliproteus coralliicola]|uniref:Phosphate/phosphite/phosphonate ABC transporter substrate-binding protein n=1 Tax=Motiliproteus coralliicola TaxID=2283196 RepID=A0A369WCH7_9GAMM|nr:phosphate/phosphite/phosphonate ABC transporter substrate-binding protein [Motiliproteus coralliicola]RDE19432.1 phosphate/phosphite/phosphonate ABC transporter substrate-binding protein [Motiliproteus coralliicola]